MLMTVTDKFSKICLLIPGNAQFIAEDWANALYIELMKANWGIPRQIISDRDPNFLSDFWKALWTAYGSRLLVSTAWHPQTDVLSERRNQSVEIALRFFAYKFPGKRWVDALISLQFSMNNSYAAVIWTSPSELISGQRMDDGQRHLGEEAPTLSRDMLREEAKLSIAQAQAAMKRRYDGKHRPMEFGPGDYVWLELGKGYHVPDPKNPA